MSARRKLGAQVVKFAVIGVGSTVLNLLLFALFRHALGNQWANITALLICTVINTALNRRYTFGAKGTGGAARVQLQSLVLLAITVAMTSGALEILRQTDPHADSLVSTGTVAVGNVIATVIRFLLLRRWFAPAAPEVVAAESAPTAL
ncbi:GtrA family protein [Allobranchiibius sp. GilTou38]|uniref:GtrA family protein n=1 Tax=Allobranchiibius sp. GilTou38 TaxID=2815210 RepID=UPI001AA0C6A0|nr:GtrA family protein [Allobranchiibius sp. GilTou38]MBO1765346.1 GtrA family protein [Allobranchiibius sp. GilTou38]